MKITREFLVLIAVILVLAGYLAFRHTDRLHYRLPEMKKVHAEGITRIDLTRSNGTISLEKKDGAWTIGPQGWQTDPEKVKGMLSALGNLKVTDLVSESGSYNRYELDAAKKVQARAFSGSRLELDITVGKAASTGQHTYVMIPGDKKVYLAEGNLNSTLAAPPSDLRNTLVLSFAPADISDIHIEHEGRQQSLVRQNGKTAAEASWKDEKGQVLDKVKVDTLLAVLSKIYCEGFLDDSQKASLGNPVFAFMLKGKKEYRLSIYDKAGNRVPALSSECSSPFALPDYKLDGIRKAIQDVSGIPDKK
jgi:hypothetical protein